MCVHYTNLNEACPKDSYPLPSIDQLVDRETTFKVLSFLDVYFDYNQIKMYSLDEEKTTFIIDGPNYCYRMMSFGLKNARVTYKKLMDKVFANQIGKNLEEYIDDMVVKSISPKQHIQDLEEIFTQGIEANPDKCEAIINMRSPQNMKEVTIGVVILVFTKGSRKSATFSQLLKKSKSFQWNEECEKAFQDLKKFLASAPSLSKTIRKA
ncbi:hypothetical protein CR513_21036, partial [Mucuna pruriens]